MAHLEKNQFVQMSSAMTLGHLLADNRYTKESAVRQAVTSAEQLWEELEARGFNAEKKGTN